MRILILGGTVFLGRHVAAAALRRGDDLTLFTRGRHGADLFPQAPSTARRPRRRRLRPRRRREWDAVIDTSGYEAEHVGRLAQRLGGPHRPLRVRLVLQRLSGVAGRAGRRGLAGVGERRRLRAAEGGERAGGRGGAARPRRVRARRADLRAARQRVPAAVVGAADRAGRTGAGARRPGAVRCSSSTRATSRRGCSTSPSGAWRARSTAPRRRPHTMGEVLEAAVAATGSGAELVLAPGRAAAGARGRALDGAAAVARRRPSSRAPGRSAPSARRPPACAAGRSPRRSPTSGPGCAPAASPSWTSGAPSTARRR